jgi:hypothetical protein
MRRPFTARLFFFSAVLLALGLTTGCAYIAGENSYRPGEEFTLVPGQSAALAGEGLDIELVEVLNDSRCPRDVVCVWAGEVKSLVDITYSNITYQVIFTQPGLSGTAGLDFRNYRFSFDVQPYPVAGEKIRPDEYRLVLKIVKLSP